MDQQVKDLINNEITNNDVCLFMKGTPMMPHNVVFRWLSQICLRF